MSDTITIRQVDLSDAQTLLLISRQTFFDAFAAQNDPQDMDIYASSAFTLQKIRSEIQNLHSRFYFAIYEDEIAGYLKLNTLTAQTEFNDTEVMEIERIYILAKYQGKKLGAQLLNFAINKAMQASCTYIWLGVWESNHNAIRFYEQNGFVKFKSHYFMLGNDKQTDVIMKKQLL